MTAEKLHDAVGLLPADLIAEADQKRQGKPRVIPWKRYAAMAACFALVASCAWFAAMVLAPKGAAESMKQTAAPAAAAPMEPEAAPEEAAANGVSGGSDMTAEGLLPAADMDQLREESAQEAGGLVSHAVQTPLKPTTACFSSSSQVTLVTSRTELNAYLTDKDWIYDFTDAQEICTAFDGAWFEDHDLLIMTVHAAYTDVPYTVTSIENTGGTDSKGWDWYVFYTTAGEGHPEGETTCFHLLTELEKGMISPEDSILTIADPIY